MGMYTEIMVRAEVSRSAPLIVVEMLRALFNRDREPHDVLSDALLHPARQPYLDHPFFRCPRWALVGGCSSYYHMPATAGRMWMDEQTGTWYIFHRSDLKNYDDEIARFFDWSRPYLRPCTGTCIGWSWYETEQAPTLIHHADE